MPTIHFTGLYYSGTDDTTALTFRAPGDYTVSEAKAAQLTHDFPHEFTRVTPAKASGSDDTPKKQSEPTKDQQPAKKGS